MDNKEKFKLSPKQLGKAWKEAYEAKDEAGGQGFVPEDGRYPMAVCFAEVGESKSSGRLQVGWEFIFLDGEYKGKTVRAYDGLDRAESLPYLMKRIESLGHDSPEDYDALPGVLKKISKEKTKFRCQVKTKGDFTNYYVDRILSDEDAPDGAEGVASGNGEEPAPARKSSASKETPQEEVGLEIEVGTIVLCKGDDGDEIGVGEIVSIDEDNQEVMVKVDGKRMIVSFNNLEKPPKEIVPAKKKLVVRK